MRRFFVDNLSGDEVALPDGEAHHARDVLRLGAGETVELFDGRGGVAAGRIASVTRRAVRAAITARREAPAPAGPGLELGFATPRPKRLDWLVEKAAELGVASLRPVVFARSVAGAKWSDARRDRCRDRCIAAAKQCGLDHLPRLHAPAPLDAYLRGVDAPLRLLGDAHRGAPLARALGGADGAAAVAILVGPAGGLTDAERAAARAGGFVPVRIGVTTLRVETAAVALPAGVRALWEASDEPARATRATRR